MNLAKNKYLKHQRLLKKYRTDLAFKTKKPIKNSRETVPLSACIRFIIPLH
jgi:hypothetical protein